MSTTTKTKANMKVPLKAGGVGFVSKSIRELTALVQNIRSEEIETKNMT